MTEIKLGSGRRQKHDYQYIKQIKSHLNSIINPEGKENMVNFSKSVADPWPHQCRYYKPCKEIVNNWTHNYAHFKRVHPWTDNEREYLLTLFEESPNSKNVYILSFLYGRSESELKTFFQTHVKHIPKWGRKAKEVDDIHDTINSQLQDLRLQHRTKIETEVIDRRMDTFWEQELPTTTYTPAGTGDAQYQIYESIPKSIVEIQSQNYLIPPPVQPDEKEAEYVEKMEETVISDKVGSKEFYKNLVDAFFEKHKAWIERETHLKNKVRELENTISELKNKLAEKIEETVISDEEEAEYTEQINQIRQPGF